MAGLIIYICIYRSVLSNVLSCSTGCSYDVDPCDGYG